MNASEWCLISRFKFHHIENEIVFEFQIVDYYGWLSIRFITTTTKSYVARSGRNETEFIKTDFHVIIRI